jgi:TonB family protein
LGILDYLDRAGTPTRWKLSAALAVFSHAVVLLGGSLVIATQPEYGMSGAVASNGGRPQVQPPQESVDLESDSSDMPAEKTLKPKPVATPPPASGGPISGGALEVPAYYRNPPPPYPGEARRLKEEGLVRLYVQLDSQGKVVSVSVSQSSGFSLLDEAALSTVKGWQFKPARMAGIAVSTSVNIPVLFRLKDARP